MTVRPAKWRRVGGLRVVMSWPEDGFSPPPGPEPRGTGRARLFGFLGAFLLVGGGITISVAAMTQQHAPVPASAAAGTTGGAAAGTTRSGSAKTGSANRGSSNTGSTGGRGPSLRSSTPVSISIPQIGVHSKLLHLGRNSNGTIQVPPLPGSANLAAWYKYSVTPGQIGASVIEGHVDSVSGPAVFFRLGALLPGNTIDVTLADGITAIFRVTGVRQYPKSDFPAKTIYAPAGYAALRLITCGGTFDYATRHYLSSTVVFASLSGHRTGSDAGS